MLKELKNKLAPKNKIVEHFQNGLLSEEECNRMLAEEYRADAIEREIHNADLMQDEMEEISWEEAHGVLGDNEDEDLDELAGDEEDEDGDSIGDKDEI